MFFTNSGTEAVEAAFKLTRRTGRTHLVAAEGAFHGRTMGALALTAKEAYRAPFEPLPGRRHLRAVRRRRGAAGRRDRPRRRRWCSSPSRGRPASRCRRPATWPPPARSPPAHGALLWLDEIQTGVGRTGQWFAHQGSTPAPDLVTLAKGLGGGIPIGACIGLGDAGHLFEPGNHGTTFGGNPVACAAGLAVLDTIRDDGLLAHATTLGEHLRAGLADPRVTEVRGAGLLIGLTLAEPRAAEVAAAGLRHGFIINAPTPDRIRLAPPLVLTRADADAFLGSWPGILGDAHTTTGGDPR